MAEDFNGWYRAGRGREMQFYATDEEIAEWLVETLPAQYAPHVILREEWAHRVTWTRPAVPFGIIHFTAKQLRAEPGFARREPTWS